MKEVSVGDSVKTKLGTGTVVQLYKHDNWCLVSLDLVKYKDFQFKISEVVVK